MMEWQPIETAPKDGTQIIIYYHDSWGHHITMTEWHPLGDWECYWDHSPMDGEITHWMPLPEPPPCS